jgi:hypothetical protein
VRRREFITLLGGAAAVLLDWRLPLKAQQANKIYRLGVLSPSNASVDSIRAVTIPELAKAGFLEGQRMNRSQASKIRAASKAAKAASKAAADNRSRASSQDKAASRNLGKAVNSPLLKPGGHLSEHRPSR